VNKNIQNNIAVFFTHEREIYVISSYDEVLEKKPDIVAIDLREGQSPNNLWPMNRSNMNRLAQELINSPEYQDIYKGQDRYIFEKTEQL